MINNFLFSYENIIHEISIKYFSLYDELNWRNKYLEILCNLLNESIAKNNKSNFNDNDINKIYEIL